MGNVVFIESMPKGSYNFGGLMKCGIKDNPLYQGLNVCFETFIWIHLLASVLNIVQVVW